MYIIFSSFGDGSKRCRCVEELMVFRVSREEAWSNVRPLVPRTRRNVVVGNTLSTGGKAIHIVNESLSEPNTGATDAVAGKAEQPPTRQQWRRDVVQ